MFKARVIGNSEHVSKLAQQQERRFVRNKSSLSSQLMIRKYSLFVLLFGLLSGTGCALLKPKNISTIPLPIPLTSVIKYLKDPQTQPVLLLMNADTSFTYNMLLSGYNLLQVIDEVEQTEFRSYFATYPDARLRMTDFMQGKMGEDLNYSGVVMDDSRLGRPLGIRQNKDVIETLWSRMDKKTNLLYFHYTKEATLYGKKASSFTTEEIVDLLKFKFNQAQIDSLSITGIHILKFTK